MHRMLNIIDAFTRECLAIRINCKLKALDVIDVPSDLFSLRGVPSHVCSDNGPEFIAQSVRNWIAAVASQNRKLKEFAADLSLDKHILQDVLAKKL